VGFRLQCRSGRGRYADKYVRVQSCQLLGERLHAIDAAGTPSILDIDVLASGPSQLIELLAKGFVVNRLIAFALGIQHADEPKLVRCVRSSIVFVDSTSS
jgi:hypothetical protein